MGQEKTAGPVRKFLSRYNTPLLWLFCGVMAVAQIDLIHKIVTGQIQRRDRSVLNEEIEKEKEEIAEMVRSVKEIFDDMKSFFGLKGSKDSESSP